MIYIGNFLKLTKVKVKCVILLVLLVTIFDMLGVFTHILETDYERFSYPLEIDMIEILSVIEQGGKPARQPINEYNFRYKIKCEAKCKLESTKEYDNVRLLYVVKSSLTHHKRRDGIRNSWGWENRFSDVTIRRIFIVGTNPNNPSLQDQIDEEYAKHKDIVQADFVDTYYNNTIKTMMAMKWIVNNCPTAQFIMFVDDDFYVSTKNVLKFIRNPYNRQIGFRKLLNVSPSSPHSALSLLYNKTNQSNQNISLDTNIKFYPTNFLLPESNKIAAYQKELEKEENNSKGSAQMNLVLFKRSLYSKRYKDFNGKLFAGYVFFSAPMRHKPSKWYVSLEEYPFSMYPPYVTAGAFVLSYSALLDLYYTSLYTKHFKFDDIYLGIVAKKAAIAPLHNENFYFWKKPYEKFSYSDVIASHGFNDPRLLQKVWEEQRSLGNA